VAAVVGTAVTATGQLTERPLDGALKHPAIGYYTQPSHDVVAALGGHVADGTARLPFDAQTGYLKPVLDALDVPVASQMLVMSKTGVQALYTSPSNPLGWVATVDEQQGLLEFCRRHQLWLLADEVYDRLYYAGAHLGDPVPSILRLATRDDAVLVVHSFSKSYCMTGWRVGWLVARRDLAQKATQLNEFIISHAPSFAQKAAETALCDGEEELIRMLGNLKENRDFCIAALERMPGVAVPKPDGAFYLFPRIEGLRDSFQFCLQLLEQHRVGLAPGVAFGAGGEGSIRLCYAADRSVLEEVPLDRKLQQAPQDEAEEDRLAEREHDRDEQEALQERRRVARLRRGPRQRWSDRGETARTRDGRDAALSPCARAVRRCDLRLVMPALAGEPPVDGDAERDEQRADEVLEPVERECRRWRPAAQKEAAHRDRVHSQGLDEARDPVHGDVRQVPL